MLKQIEAEEGSAESSCAESATSIERCLGLPSSGSKGTSSRGKTGPASSGPFGNGPTSTRPGTAPSAGIVGEPRGEPSSIASPTMRIDSAYRSLDEGVAAERAARQYVNTLLRKLAQRIYGTSACQNWLHQKNAKRPPRSGPNSPTGTKNFVDFHKRVSLPKWKISETQNYLLLRVKPSILYVPECVLESVYAPRFDFVILTSKGPAVSYCTVSGDSAILFTC